MVARKGRIASHRRTVLSPSLKLVHRQLAEHCRMYHVSDVWAGTRGSIYLTDLGVGTQQNNVTLIHKSTFENFFGPTTIVGTPWLTRMQLTRIHSAHAMRTSQAGVTCGCVLLTVVLIRLRRIMVEQYAGITRAPSQTLAPPPMQLQHAVKICRRL